MLSRSCLTKMENRARAMARVVRHVPMAGDELTPDVVDTFRSELAPLSRPVYVHADDRAVAGAFALMDRPVRSELSAERALSHATAFGLRDTDRPVKEFVEQYISERVTT